MREVTITSKAEPSASVLALPRSAACVLLGLLTIPALLTLTERGFYCDDHYFLLRAERGDLHDALRDNLKMFGSERLAGYLLAASQYQFLGDNAILQHAFVMAMHFGTIVCIYLLLVEVFTSRAAAIAGAGLFAVVPWHTQAIFWILCAQVVVSTALTILAAWILVRSVRNPSHSVRLIVLSATTYALAVLFYEQNLSWLAAFPLLAWCADRRSGAMAALRRTWPHMLVAVSLALVLVFESAPGRRQAHPELGVGHFVTGLGHLLYVTFNYHIYLTLAGVRSFHVPVLQEWLEGSPWKIVGLAISLIGAACGALAAVRPLGAAASDGLPVGRCLLAGSAMFVGPIALMAFAPNPVIEQRGQYLASCGLAFLFALAVTRVVPLMSRYRGGKFAGWTILALVLGSGAIVTATRSTEWVESRRMQDEFQVALHEALPIPPKGAILIIDGFPPKVGFAAFTYGNEWGIGHLVRRTYGRDDIKAYTSAHLAEDGTPCAGSRGSLPSELFGDRVVFFFRFTPASGDLVRDTELSY